ncbi:Mobilization protein C, partial [Brucella intermedia M86]
KNPPRRVMFRVRSSLAQDFEQTLFCPLHRLEHGKDEEFSRRLGEWLKRELPDFLTRPGDKELFADLIDNAPAGETTGSAGGTAA